MIYKIEDMPFRSRLNILPSIKAHCNTYSINLFVGEVLEVDDCSVKNFNANYQDLTHLK